MLGRVKVEGGLPITRNAQSTSLSTDGIIANEAEVNQGGRNAKRGKLPCKRDAV
jgi:hypothetical protein